MKMINGGFGGYHGYHGRESLSPLSVANKSVDDDALYEQLKQLELSQSFGDLIKEKKTLITAGQLGSDTTCSVINPGALYQNNEFQLLCRGEADETVWVGDFLAHQANPLWCTLDRNLTIKESFFLRYLEFPPQSRAEDWRLFEYQGKLYTNHSVYQLLDRQEWIVRSRPGISEIDLQNRTLRLRWMLDPPFEASSEEKNWSFFVHNGSLMCIYSFKPYIILEIDLERGITKKLLEVDLHYKWYEKGKFIRNSTNLVSWDDGHYIMFIHDFLDPRYEPRNRTYMQYASLISKKTLLPTNIIAEPVQMGGEEGGRHPGVHYTSALVNQEEGLYAFYGQGDSHTGVVVFDKDILNSSFKSVSRTSIILTFSKFFLRVFKSTWLLINRTLNKLARFCSAQVFN